MARAWNTKASISMPAPLTAQPISAAAGPALRATFCGSEKMPAPTIEPTTSAVSAARPRRWLDEGIRRGAGVGMPMMDAVACGKKQRPGREPGPLH